MIPFGAVARCLGYLTHVQIQEALAIQKIERSAGHSHRRIGQILVEIGGLTAHEVETVLERQRILNRRFTLHDRSISRPVSKSTSTHSASAER